MEYKIGDEVIFIDKEFSTMWEGVTKISLYGKAAKIINIYEEKDTYLLEFKDPIGSNYDGEEQGKYDHCKWFEKSRFKLAINY